MSLDLTSSAAHTDDSSGVSREARPALRLAIVWLIAAVTMALFLTIDVNGYWDYILPRRIVKIAAMVLTAYAIGVSTVLFQTITSNRILTPSLMGFDALYVFLQTVFVFVFSASGVVNVDPRMKFVFETCVMVALATLLFRWLFLGRQLSLHLVLLVGIILGTLFRSMSSLMQRLMDPSEFIILQDMFFASFNTVAAELLGLSALLVALVSIPVFRHLRAFDVLTLGREAAINLGVNYELTVTKVLMIIAVLASVSTALVGPITFFGLLVANLAYMIAGSHRHVFTLPMATALGIVALVGGQLVLERIFEFNTSLSVVVEFLGGITFLVILIKSARTGVSR